VKVHAPLPPIRCAVREEFLYNEERGHGNLVPGAIFSVSSYPGHALTFQALLDGGGVFSYLPLSALVDPRRYDPKAENLTLDELLYHDCKDEEIVVHRFPMLRRPARVFFRTRGRWMGARYLFTVDWWRGNDLLHALKLENGQLAALPSHKILFGKEGPLPEYKKLRQTYRVGR
jgi:hypothetical protein